MIQFDPRLSLQQSSAAAPADQTMQAKARDSGDIDGAGNPWSAGARSRAADNRPWGAVRLASAAPPRSTCTARRAPALVIRAPPLTRGACGLRDRAQWRAEGLRAAQRFQEGGCCSDSEGIRAGLSKVAGDERTRLRQHQKQNCKGPCADFSLCRRCD